MEDPAATYLRRSIEIASPIGLIVLLFQRAVLALRRAADAIERGDIETRTHELRRALAIVGELRSVLNHDRGGSIARQFDQFYSRAETMILDASCKQRTQPLLELCDHFTRIRDAWQQVDARPNASGVQPEARANTAGEVRRSWNV